MDSAFIRLAYTRVAMIPLRGSSASALIAILVDGDVSRSVSLAEPTWCSAEDLTKLGCEFRGSLPPTDVSTGEIDERRPELRRQGLCASTW
jgi:hypothetical protein